MSDFIDHSRVNQVEIAEDEADQRLDNYLSRILKGVPKSLIYRIIRKGEVRINKKRCQASSRLAAGDIVRIPPVRVAAQNETPTIAQELLDQLEAAVLFEDEHCLILNKPAGLAVHGGSGLKFGVIEAMRQLRPYAKALELAHRLDRDTSGCLILAKNRQFLKQIHALIRDDKIHKEYTALVHGKWQKFMKILDKPLKKNVLSSGERIVRVSADGKASLTLVQSSERYKTASKLTLELKTGRTHQIRVHTADAGHPVIGDPKYGNKEADKLLEEALPKRMYLHASYIEFKLSDSVAAVKVHAPLPAAFKQAARYLKKMS